MKGTRPGEGLIPVEPEPQAHARRERLQIAEDAGVRANGQAELLTLGIPRVDDFELRDGVEDGLDAGFRLGPASKVPTRLELRRDGLAGVGLGGVHGREQSQPDRHQDERGQAGAKHGGSLAEWGGNYPGRGGGG